MTSPTAGKKARYQLLATDYDGTIAHHGVVDPATTDALITLRDRGWKLALVTGRDLDSLSAAFSRVDLFDRVVAENGAVLFDPASGRVRTLTSPPPADLLAALRARAVPLDVGRSIVATIEPHEHDVLSAIKQLGLEWHVIFNKGAVMALPSGVNKASGLTCALRELKVSAAATVAVGDAENDHAFMELCGLSVAVANALPGIREAADVVTANADGAGVRELIDWLIADPPLKVARRRSIDRDTK